MNSTLAILTLTSPLWLTPIIIYVIYRISKTIFGEKYKFLSTFAILSIIFLLLSGQKITASIYHSYLCNNEYGFKNYTKIRLPEEYWYKDGSPKFVDEDNKIDFKIINPWFTSRTIETPEVDTLIKINKLSYTYFDKNNNKVAEIIDFVRYYGWRKEYTLERRLADSCNLVFANKNGWDKYNEKRKQDRYDFYINLFTK